MAEDIKTEKQQPQKRQFIIPIAIVIAILAGGYFINESKYQSTN